MLFPLEPYFGSRICVALSGGADSVCLLHYLHSGAKEFQITLSAIHCEHGIRGEASCRDLAFCEELCRAWKIPLEVVKADVPALAKAAGQGLEEAGRNFRYSAFLSLIREGKADFVATAHHAGDAAETILFRLARGTSLAGMRAITERQGIIRPLLNTTRAQIEKYLEEHALPHVEDETNADERYTRNYIRHTALPAFEKISERAAEHLNQFAALAARDDEFLYELARREITTVEDDLFIPADLPAPLFSRACLICMGQTDYTGANLAEIAKLKTLQSGKKVCLRGGQEAAREYDKIVFYRPAPPIEAQPFVIEEWLDGEGKLMVDLDAFPSGCVVRGRQTGDFIIAFGGQRKTLKKFLTDKKIPARRGNKLKLIANGSEILVVIGVEISDRVKITDTTVRKGCIG